MSTRKRNEDNERIKRKYMQYLRGAKRRDHSTVDKAMDAILRFETYTKFKSFKRFRIEQAMGFVAMMEDQTNARTGKPLAKSTIAATLAALRNFFEWLAGQQGYKSKISYSDKDYFNLSLKASRIANHRADIPYPSLEQCWHLFQSMLDGSDIARRNKAFVAFLMITALRDGAASSLRLKHIDLVEGAVHQDARQVRTKFSKTFTTWFMPVRPEYREFFDEYVHWLREDQLFGPEDPLFPKPKMMIGNNGGFQSQGLSRDLYASANGLRVMFGNAFYAAGLPKFSPHSIRKTVTKWGQAQYRKPEALKAFSQNLGHESVVTTIDSYCPVSAEEQRRLISAVQ